MDITGFPHDVEIGPLKHVEVRFTQRLDPPTYVPGARGEPLTGWDAWYERERELPPQNNLGY